MLHEKIIFYPLSALHVVVTEIVYSQWRRLLSSWRKKQLNEKTFINFDVELFLVWFCFIKNN